MAWTCKAWAMTSVVIRGGTVFDGTGAPGRVADVLVRDGVVADIGADLDVPAGTEVIDATGRWVTPGFLDCHTHYDAEVELDPRIAESVRHGVTTVLVGSCGLSFAMGTPEDLADQFCRVESVPRDAVLPTLERVMDWDDPVGYLDHLDSLPLGPNVVAMFGHSAVRAATMGLARSVDPDERPSEAEQLRMEAWLHDALDAGYLGMSFNTLPWDKVGGDRHNSQPTPSVHATWKEYRAFAKILRRRRRVLQVVPDLAGGANILPILALSVGRFRRSLKVSLLAMLDSANIPKAHRISGLLSRATNRVLGGDVRWQALPHRFEMLVDGLEVPVMEEFAAGTEALALSVEDRKALASDPAWRERFRRDWADRLARRAYHRKLGEPTIVECPDESLCGRSFEDVARERGVDPIEAFLDLQAEWGEKLRWRTLVANGDPDEVAWIMGHPDIVVGFSDAGAHLRNMAFYDFPLHLLRIARDRPEAIAPERAVQRLTSEIADWFGFNAGRLVPGARADVAVVDPATLDERLDVLTDDEDAVDLLGVARIVRRHDECVPAVLVHGRVAWRDGEFAEDFGRSHDHGTVLRASSATRR
jgi:N-acyl-D-aspartate/D-glutamate deacylase